MARKKKIIFWIATIWLSAGMLSTGMVQLLRTNDEIVRMNNLGYPDYLLTIIGVCKILGVAIILLPRFSILKEWAYAGFFITMAGAVASHLFKGHHSSDIFGPILLIALTMTSWYFRPVDRRPLITV